MNETTRGSLSRSQLVDITTTGRRTGRPRRIEIVLHNFDGQLIISGRPSPRPRAWIRNLEADPRLIVHVKDGVRADVPAVARVITDPAERREVLAKVARAWRRDDVDEMVAHSPLIEVTVAEERGAADAA